MDTLTNGHPAGTAYPPVRTVVGGYDGLSGDRFEQRLASVDEEFERFSIGRSDRPPGYPTVQRVDVRGKSSRRYSPVRIASSVSGPYPANGLPGSFPNLICSGTEKRRVRLDIVSDEALSRVRIDNQEGPFDDGLGLYSVYLSVPVVEQRYRVMEHGPGRVQLVPLFEDFRVRRDVNRVVELDIAECTG